MRLSAPARVGLAGVAYFAFVFVIAFALGAGRTFALEPQMPKLIATAIEAPFVLAAIALGAYAAPRRFKIEGDPGALLLSGWVGLVLQQAADAGLAFGLRGLTPAQHYAQFLTPEGWLFAVLLGLYALGPWLLRPRSGRSASAIS